MKLLPLLTALLLSACSALGQTPVSLSMDKALWKLDAGGLYNTLPDGNLALAFKFRPWAGYNGKWDGYLAQGFRIPLSFTTEQTLTIHVRITTLSGEPYFRTDDWKDNLCPPCCTPASFRPYFTSGPLYGPDLARWWSNPATIILVSPSDVVLTTTFDPAQWSSVYGGRGSDHLTEFLAALAHVQYLGATMGGGCFFGHGVTTDGGTAMLELISYEIQ